MPPYQLEPQQPAAPVSSHVASGLSLQFVDPPKPAPNYDTEVLQLIYSRQATAQAGCSAQGGKLVGLTCVLPPPTPPQPAPVMYVASVQLPGGSHTDWMGIAGIEPYNFGYADYIISHESGWDPTNWYGKPRGYPYNPLSSAAGLPQALPYSKTGCAWGDPICQLIWANGYAKSRYGSWANAYNNWTVYHNW